MNLSPYIKEQIDKALQYRSEIDGFIITNKDVGVPTVWMCPWQGHHHNVILPNVALNIDRLPKNWRDELAQFESIRALYILTDVIDLDFIKNFQNLEELHVIGSSCKDWNFLSKLTELSTLCIRKAPYFNTAPIRVLAEKQAVCLEQFRAALKTGNYLPLPQVLDEISLTYCGLTDADLVSLNANKCITEIDLSHNSIKSVELLKDVSVYYLTLRYNELTDLECMQFAPYYLNVRHNQITKLPNFDKMKHGQLSRLYVGYNPLPETEIVQIKNMKLLKSDL